MGNCCTQKSKAKEDKGEKVPDEQKKIIDEVFEKLFPSKKKERKGEKGCQIKE